MINYWDERFGSEEYVYGDEPNVFFAEQISKLKPGKIILPCEGEGRNAVYAASLGWKVFAFDSSEAGKRKAMLLADRKGVSINYQLEDIGIADFPYNEVDVVAFIYAHFSTETRTIIHQKAINWLKPGGTMLLEAFNPAQLNNTSGGPKDLDMLYTIEMLTADFSELNIKLLQPQQVVLSEGRFHDGEADIIRFRGIKETP